MPPNSSHEFGNKSGNISTTKKALFKILYIFFFMVIVYYKWIISCLFQKLFESSKNVLNS